MEAVMEVHSKKDINTRNTIPSSIRASIESYTLASCHKSWYTLTVPKKGLLAHSCNVASTSIKCDSFIDCVTLIVK